MGPHVSRGRVGTIRVETNLSPSAAAAARLSLSAQARLGKEMYFSFVCAPPIDPSAVLLFLLCDGGRGSGRVVLCRGERPRSTGSAERRVARSQPWPMRAFRESECVRTAPCQRWGPAADTARPPPRTYSSRHGSADPLPRPPAEANPVPSLPLPHSGASTRDDAQGPPLACTEDLSELRDGFRPFYFPSEGG